MELQEAEQRADMLRKQYENACKLTPPPIDSFMAGYLSGFEAGRFVGIVEGTDDEAFVSEGVIYE